MSTRNNKAGGQADKEKRNTAKQILDSYANESTKTPVRNEAPLTASEAVTRGDGSGAFHSPANNASQFIETPIQSNVRRVRTTDDNTGDNDESGFGNTDAGSEMLPAFDEQHVSKSVSFEKEKEYASKAIRKETKEDMIKRLNMDLDNDKLKNDSTYQTSNVKQRPVCAPLTELFDMYSPFSSSDKPPVPDFKERNRNQEPQVTSLSIPKLSSGERNEKYDYEKNRISNADDGNLGTKREYAFSSINTSRMRSTLSEMSSGSVDDDDTLDDGTLSDSPQREPSLKALHVSGNQRMSLTTDLETGKSPGTGPSQFHRGQSVMRRSLSSDMIAQSPRTRRRRTMSQNMEQLLKETKKRLSLPPVIGTSDHERRGIPAEESKHESKDDELVLVDIEKGMGDTPTEMQRFDRRLSLSANSRRDSVRFTDHHRRIRYNVSQQSVRDVVQYRLSALTPTELRRRKYKNSLMASETIAEYDENDGDKDHESDNAWSKFKKCLKRAVNIFVELGFSTLSQGKHHFSSGIVNRLLYWSFRNNFIVVFMLAACSFYSWTIVFAVFLYLIGLDNPKCIHVNGLDFDETRGKFADAFALSWTTFTTVGYGLVFPGTTATIPEDFNIGRECSGMVIMTTMEAFVGILFSAFWGAIFFAKVTRVAAFAQVTFSDFVIIKYGTGVTGVAEDDEYGSSEDDDEPFPEQSKLPCPFLEFRIANRLWHRQGGEIIDASINIVASMEESQALIMFDNKEAVGVKKRRKGKKKARDRVQLNRQRRRRSKDSSDDDDISDFSMTAAIKAANDMVDAYVKHADRATRRNKRMSSSFTRDKTKKSQVEKDGNVPNLFFAKLSVESLEHPFFKRVWNVRHILDESSPILKPEAKELIRLNNGHWPKQLNNANAVRASIHFDQILVSFSGTSNVDANSVYSQKIYNFDDVCVGYSFCNMLFRDKSDGSIGLDFKLLNDVNEQSGGGGEPLDFKDAESTTGSLRDVFFL